MVSANFLAIGLAYTRPPLGAAAGAGVPAGGAAAGGGGVGAAAGAGAGAAAGGGGGGGAAAAGGGGGGGGAAAADAPESVKLANALTLDCSGTMMHNSLPMGTSLVPPGIKILAR